jgi:hypothetical protein
MIFTGLLAHRTMFSNMVSSFQYSRFLFMTLILLFVCAQAGCGNGRNEVSQEANQPGTSPAVLQNSQLTLPFTRSGLSTDQSVEARQQLSSRSNENPETLRDTQKMAQLSKLPHLSRMSQGDIAKLYDQLRKMSLSQRSEIFKNNLALMGLPTQQKYLLLEQLANIVPDETPAMFLVCTCKSGPRHAMCFKEVCTQTTAISSICEAICGTSNLSSSSCTPSSQCAASQPLHQNDGR